MNHRHKTSDVLPSFAGDPRAIGAAYGKTFADHITRNVDCLIRKYKPALPRCHPEFQRQVRRQERMMLRQWPWLLEEMAAVAEAAGIAYEDILAMNLRAWWFRHYYAIRPRTTAGSNAKLSLADSHCSSLAVRLADGTVACAGALDDTQRLYAGPLRFMPAEGYSFITFPIIGTSWGNRGLNSAGLALGESSQGLSAGAWRKLPREINADLAQRIILQTCATVDDVREFCRAYPFMMNLVAVDARGQTLGVHQTLFGLFAIATRAPCALTNHITSDRLIYELHERGIAVGPESPTSRLRLGKLLGFIERRAGRCKAMEVRALLAEKSLDASSLCPAHNVALTYANPQAEPGILRVAQPRVARRARWKKLKA